MNLDFFNNLTNNLKENKVIQNFIEELGELLEKNIKASSEKLGILNQIQNQRSTSIASRNTMKKEMTNVLTQYANQTLEKGEMYFIVSKNTDKYTIYRYENNNENILQLNQNEIPKEAGVNSILRIQNGRYILDIQDTQNVINKITKMANEVLDKQDKQLKEFRQEGHLYRVEEDRNNRIYLTDITDTTNNIVLEEVNFPKELLKHAGEGSVFLYQNGTYHVK